jgi:DNA-binding beta-propeller fold protein YncE
MGDLLSARSPTRQPRRITEPFVKGRFSLLLIDMGAVEVTVSVDGQEVDADEIRRLFLDAGFNFVAKIGTRSPYVGVYRRGGVTVGVGAGPGPDVIAVFPDGRRLYAECKGERTAAGIRAGTDWAGFCEVLGQLLMAVGDLEQPADFAVLVLPNTPRVVGFAERAVRNRFSSQIPVIHVVVHHDGRVDFVGPSINPG